MTYFANIADVTPVAGAGHIAYPMLDTAHGCVNGCLVGISVYSSTEYGVPGVHEDQECFVVLEGTGWAKVGDEEHAIRPQTCFIAPAGTPHTVKRDPGSPHVKVCWFHAAI